MTPSPIQLADDVFFCMSDKRIVFLDLLQNKYLCLNKHNSLIADNLFSGSKAPGVVRLTETNAGSDEDTQRVVRALTNQGLLAQSNMIGKPATAVRVPAPETFLRQDASTPRRINFGHCAAFAQASVVASCKLRWYSMQRTVRSIENRRQQKSKSPPIDVDVLFELVTVFFHLRPYYSREYLCLYDSLALLEFLAHYRLYPKWVFGVTAEPFAAHCWVQENGSVLNDSTEVVSRFTPIMVV